MQGAGAHYIRDLLAGYGRPGLVCAPFLRITGKRPNLAWLLRQSRRTQDLPLSVQLLGSHAEHLAETAAALSAAGVDVVDLNLGCPSRQVNRKGVGAALLGEVDAISRILERMRAACRTRLSVKMRSGDGTPEHVMKLARVIQAAGADFLVLHPRTRAQGYQGIANWNLVKRVKSELRIPVVGNGDCWYAADVPRLMQQTGCDAIMLGRPALRNPFIFRQIEELLGGRRPLVPTGADVYGHIQRLAELFQREAAGTRSGPLGALKEQLRFLLRAIPQPERASIEQGALCAVTLDELWEALRPLPELPLWDLAAEGPLRLESTPVIETAAGSTV